jgi:hypothetical protein
VAIEPISLLLESWSIDSERLIDYWDGAGYTRHAVRGVTYMMTSDSITTGDLNLRAEPKKRDLRISVGSEHHFVRLTGGY